MPVTCSLHGHAGQEDASDRESDDSYSGGGETEQQVLISTQARGF